MKTYLKIIPILATLLVGCGGDLGENKHTQAWIVTELGNCSGGEGFFGGNYECAIKATNAYGRVEFMKVYGDVMVGQTVYKHCWTEDNNVHCFSTARTSVRKGYESKM